MRRGGVLPALALLVGAVACNCDRSEPSEARGAPMSDPGPDPAPEPPQPSPPIAKRAPAPRVSHRDDPWPIADAPLEDEAWSGTEPVEARRLVYRVHLHVPRVLGEAPPTIPDAAAELFVDASEERLRARFVGPGWPVEAGSEVRLRRGEPGVYVFDAQGGRWLPPGELAAWFQGGHAGRDAALVRVRRPPPQENPGTGEIVCALLAEWAGQERETLMRRCGDGPPAMFRLGPWRAERTADVPVELPRSALRADHVGPPRRIAESDSRAFMEPALLGRLEPKRARDGSGEGPREDAPPEGIVVQNDSRSRIVVTAHGLPIGWVDPGAEGHFVGLAQGQHVIAAMRPLGQLAYRPRGIHVPASIRVR